MGLARIPKEYDHELFLRAEAGQSSRQLAEWLEEEHQLTTSHVTVSRRLHALKLARGLPPTQSSAELERLLQANDVLLLEADEGLAEVQNLALHKDDDFGSDYDLSVAERMASRRASLAVTVSKLLMQRLQAAQQREAWSALDARPRPAAPPPEPLPATRVVPSLPVTPTMSLPAPVAAPEPTALAAPTRPGRNERCPCGSGMKFKKCCLGKSETGAGLSDVKHDVKQEMKQQWG